VPTIVPLPPVGGSPVSATATIAPAGAGVQLTIEASNLRPGSQYAVLLHGGSCTQPSASVARLGTIAAGGSGRARLTATSVEGPGGRIDLSPDWLADGRIVDLQGADGTMVACGPLTTTAAPARLPRTGDEIALGALAAVGAFSAVVGLRLRRR
jgi:hypothetical protein